MTTRSTRLFAFCLSLALVAIAGGIALSGGVLAEAAGQETADGPLGGLAQQDIDADDVVMTADLRANGSAEWRVAYRIRLDDDSEIQAFEDLQADINANESLYLGPFADRMERTVADAETTTGREMNASDFAVSTDRRTQPDVEFGVVTYRFEWEGFAAIEDDGNRLRAGDAVDRLFLEEGVQLQIHWPDAFGLQTVDPDLDDRLTVEDTRVVWRGPLDFDTGQPRVVVSQSPATADEQTDDDTTDEGATDDSSTDGSSADDTFPWVVFPVFVVLALVVGAGGVALWIRRVSTDDGDDSNTDDTAGGAGAEAAAGPPPELLSNEERVLQLLEDNGGRMKQQAVADRLDWTAAKTSQVVGDLRDDDEVEAFRLGRENVLTLPDVDIDANTDADIDTDDENEPE